VPIVQWQYRDWVDSGGSPTVTLPQLPTVGNILVAFEYAEDGSTPALDYVPIGFTQLVQGGADLATQSACISTRTVLFGDGRTVSCVGSNGGTSRFLAIYEVNGAVDQSGVVPNGASADHPLVGPTLTPTAPGILLAGFFARVETFDPDPIFTPQGGLITDRFIIRRPGRGIAWVGRQLGTLAGVPKTPAMEHNMAGGGKQNIRIAVLMTDGLTRDAMVRDPFGGLW
jgi:hypothetical protein